MKNLVRIAVLAAVIITYVYTAYAQLQSVVKTDHLFPVRGNSTLTVATGIPYVAAAEFAYGISNRFSIGLLAASAPPASAYGIRIRAILYRSGDVFRLYFRTPLLYYPPHPALFCGEPWVLAWPVVSGEWTLQSGTRISLGGGVVGAACVHSLLGHSKNGERFMGGIWNTIHAGVAVPMSGNLVFHAEISAVMSGAKIAGEDWIARFPAIAVLGFSYALE